MSTTGKSPKGKAKGKGKDKPQDCDNGPAGDNLILGGPAAEVLVGGPGDDTINGAEGDDTLCGGPGDDTLRGEEGDDLLKGGTGDDRILAGPGQDTLFGGDGNDSLFGEDGDDLIHGEDGDDLLAGQLGNDTITGGAGDDTILGDEGDDLLHGEAGNDLIFGGAGNDTLFGGDGDDTLKGGDGDDVITGGAGADRMYGGDGRDVFTGITDGDQVYGGAGGDDFDTLDLTGVGRFRLVDLVTDSDGNGLDGRVEFLDADGNVTGSMTFENIEKIIPCFTPGTMIVTARGEKPVEALEVGDKVITRDNGIREIRWIGRRQLTARELAAAPHLQPVLIRAGALGNGLPERDMLVSPNHRMLIANGRTALYFGEHEVLAAAKHLVDDRGVLRTAARTGITYIHFMFDQHEVVLANGAWTESFQPGDLTLKGMGREQRAELLELFPDLATLEGIAGYAAARRTLKAHEARLLL